MTPGCTIWHRDRSRAQPERGGDSQDFESAAALRDKEKELLTGKDRSEADWTAAAADRLPVVEELARVNAELARLRMILHQHGIESEAGGA